MAANRIYFEGYELDIFDTGNQTVWNFEVYKDNRLIGEGYRFKSEGEALEAAKSFAGWYVR